MSVITNTAKLLVLTLLLAGAAAAQDYLPELVKRIKPSSVAVETFDSKGNTVSRGSGFFIAPDRIVTNRHVIERSARVEIHLIDGKKFLVKGVLAVDGEGDLAMLQVDVPRQFAIPLPIVRAVPQEGESIVVVGNPFGLEGSVSNGIVSAVREISGYGRHYPDHCTYLARFVGLAGREYVRSGDRHCKSAGSRRTEFEFRDPVRAHPAAEGKRASERFITHGRNEPKQTLGR